MKSNLDYLDQSQNGRSGSPPAYTPRNEPQRQLNNDLNWCEMTQKNKPQGNSGALEIMMLLSGGIMFGNVVFSTRHFYEPWTLNSNGNRSESKSFIALSLSSFLFAVAVGALSYHYLMKLIRRKLLRQIPCLLFYISGIIFIVTPDVGFFVIFARVFGGLATGMALVFLVIKMPEVSVVRIRGMNTSIGAIMSGTMGMVTVGSVVEIDFLNYQDKSTDPWINTLRMYGILIISFTFMGHLISFLLDIESPVYLLQQGDVCAAKLAMCKLRNESAETWEIQRDREDLQRLVDEDRNLSASIFKDSNLRSLILVTVTRLAFVFSFNFPLNSIMLNFVNTKFFTLNDQGSNTLLYAYGGMILGNVRILGMFGLFTFDLVGRKKMFLISATGTIISGLVFGITLIATEFNESTLTVLAVVAIIYQVFQCIAIAGVADIFAGEAFALPKKAASIGFSVAVEYLAQAILLLTTFKLVHKYRPPDETPTYYGEFTVFLVMMLALLGCTVFVWLKCPETKTMTIRETRSEFRGSLYETHTITSAYA